MRPANGRVTFLLLRGGSRKSRLQSIRCGEHDERAGEERVTLALVFGARGGGEPVLCSPPMSPEPAAGGACPVDYGARTRPGSYAGRSSRVGAGLHPGAAIDPGQFFSS